MASDLGEPDRNPEPCLVDYHRAPNLAATGREVEVAELDLRLIPTIEDGGASASPPAVSLRWGDDGDERWERFYELEHDILR